MSSERSNCNQKGREASKGRSRQTQRVLTPTRPLRHARSDRARTNIHTTTGQYNRRFVLRLLSVISDHICITNMPNLCRCHKTDTQNTSQTKSHSFIFHIKSPDSTSSHTSSLPKIANSEALVLYSDQTLSDLEARCCQSLIAAEEEQLAKNSLSSSLSSPKLN